jgi:hypothetical protein
MFGHILLLIVRTKERNMSNREKALELVATGMVSAEDMLIMALKYMSEDDVADMLDVNELSDRFHEEYDDDMDGDHESALASAGFGTDEDYGYYGGDDY